MEDLLPLGSTSLCLSTQQLWTREALHCLHGPMKLFFFFPAAAVCSSGHHGVLQGTGDGHGPATWCSAAVESPVPALQGLGHLRVTVACGVVQHQLGTWERSSHNGGTTVLGTSS